MIRFFMAMEPPTKTFQAKRLGMHGSKPVLYDSPELKEIKAKLEAHLAKHVPAEPLNGAVRVMVKWLYPISGTHIDGQYKTTKPDIDNAGKALLDAMTALGFWRDDAQVASYIAEKFWAATPGIYVEIVSI